MIQATTIRNDQDAYEPRLGSAANLAFFNDAGVLLDWPRHHVPHSALYGLLLKPAAVIFYHAFRRLLTYSSARSLARSLSLSLSGHTEVLPSKQFGASHPDLAN